VLRAPVLSAASIARLGRLRREVEAVRPGKGVDMSRIGLLHPRQAFGLREIGPSGDLAEPAAAEFDLLVVDRPLSPDRCEIDFIALKSRLACGGVILLRKRPAPRPGFWSWFRPTPKRRRDDRQGPDFGGGVDRAEQNLRRSGLYVSELADRRRGEQWFVASPQPFPDTRHRDHIGRVSRDFLNWSIGWALLPDLPGVTAFAGAQRLAR
jgi:hypothetical protein